MKYLSYVCVTLLLSTATIFAGTTGKIAGKVTDQETGEPLPGANVILEGTTRGAATGLDGSYVIVNVPPGLYTLRISMIGYADYVVQNLRVNIDLTTRIDAALESEVLTLGEEITVVAERPVVLKDVSSSEVFIQEEEVRALPVKRINEVIGFQAGILSTQDTGINIRGGGSDEIAFMIDGFTLRDERNNQAYTAISLSAVQDIQVQTGGFNAEYGNIRSGVINVVTKEGSRERYSGTLTVRYRAPGPKHFGPSGFGANAYWTRPYLDDEVAWTGTDSWDEHTQRQYPSFEGWNAISRRTLQDDDPNNDLTPEAAQRVWKWQHRKRGDIQDPDYTVDLGFGGPVPFIGKPFGDLRFFFSHRREQNAYLIRLSRDTYNDEITQLKLTSNITPSMKLIVTGLYGQIQAVIDNQIGLPSYFYSPASVASELSQRSFINTIMFATDYFAPTRIRRYMVSAKLTHSLSSRSFYEAKVEHQSHRYRTFPRALRDTTGIRKFGNNYWVDEAPFGFWPLPSAGIDGMRMGVGMSNSRDSTRIFTTSFKFDLTSQLNPTNELKTGVELVVNHHEARYGGVDITLPAGRPSSRWDRTPIRGAFYVQDKLEFRGLIANLGVRLDYSNAGGAWFDAGLFSRDFFSSSFEPDAEEEFEGATTEPKLYVSPRLGISHPITDRSKLFFNYGHFYSMPEAQRLYMVQRATDRRVQRIGNPNLDLSRTIAYEIGYEQSLFEQFLLRLAGYYKDVSNQPNWVRVISADSKVNYLQANDNFYEDIRGIEVSLEKRFGTWFGGFVNYTYMVQTSGFFGRLRLYENPAEQRAFDRQNIEQFKPVPRPFFRANLVFNTPPAFGPEVAGLNLFGNWTASVLALWREGVYGTWTRGLDPNLVGIRNNVQWPDFFNVNLRLTKRFRVAGSRLRFFVDIDNLFNRRHFSFYGFSDGNDFRDYMDSLLWPREIGQPLGYTVFGDDKIGDLRPEDVAYDPLEPNPDNDPEIAARNQRRRETKSYIDNPNQRWLYFLNPRNVVFGLSVDF